MTRLHSIHFNGILIMLLLFGLWCLFVFFLQAWDTIGKVCRSETSWGFPDRSVTDFSSLCTIVITSVFTIWQKQINLFGSVSPPHPSHFKCSKETLSFGIIPVLLLCSCNQAPTKLLWLNLLSHFFWIRSTLLHPFCYLLDKWVYNNWHITNLCFILR